MSIFRPADILLPKGIDNSKWSVVACDQFTSQPEYWVDVEKIVGDSPSTLSLVYPEAYLSEGDSRINRINDCMKKYLDSYVLEEYKNCVIYVERYLSEGRIRRGIIGAIDLEAYDFNKGSKSAIRATEGTVLERIPPRVKIRENAPLELPHAILLIDDIEDNVMSSVQKGEKLYDFELIKNGGRLVGYKTANTVELLKAIDKMECMAADQLAYAVGDGNHSLATAKTCWDNIKTGLTDEERENHPARFCLVEIENIHDSALEFEPIHRIVFNTDPEILVNDLIKKYDASDVDNGGQHIIYMYGDTKGDIYIKNAPCGLAVGTLQKFLDEYGCEVDYIHGADVVENLSKKNNSCGFILPKPSKSDLFSSVISDGALPRKTFSMGEACEKRYYMEAKRIK